MTESPLTRIERLTELDEAFAAWEKHGGEEEAVFLLDNAKELLLLARWACESRGALEATQGVLSSGSWAASREGYKETATVIDARYNANALLLQSFPKS